MRLQRRQFLHLAASAAALSALSHGAQAQTYPTRPITMIVPFPAAGPADVLARILSEPRQVLWVYDQDAWAKGLDYSTRPLEISRAVYSSVRSAITYYAASHYEKDGHLEFVHSVTGVRTLKDEFDKVANHNEHHLEQIRSALRRIAVT